MQPANKFSPSLPYIPDDKLRYITSKEIADEAETNLVEAEDDAAYAEMARQGKENEPYDECDSQYVEYGRHARLTIKEVREIYDNLPPTDKANVKAAALRFVALVKQYKPFTNYDFDDGLMDVARLGVFVAHNQ
jgi:hypothetical protein